jgi:hypothetical protein
VRCKVSACSLAIGASAGGAGFTGRTCCGGGLIDLFGWGAWVALAGAKMPMLPKLISAHKPSSVVVDNFNIDGFLMDGMVALLFSERVAYHKLLEFAAIIVILAIVIVILIACMAIALDFYRRIEFVVS